jgi:hypothetical protein
MPKPHSLSPGDKIALLTLVITVALQAVPLNAATRSIFLLIALGAALYLTSQSSWQRWKKWALCALLFITYFGITFWIFEREARAERRSAPTTDIAREFVSLLWTIPWRWVLPAIVGTAILTAGAFLIAGRRRREVPTGDSGCGYNWAHEIADYETRRVQKFIIVEDCEIDASHLAKGEFYLDFKFPILNLSMFTISILMAEGTVVENSILFKGGMLSREAKLAKNHVKHVNPTDRSDFTIRQWVNPEERTEIMQILKKSGNLFDFSQAVVNVSIDEFPQAGSMKLDLTGGMRNASLENKVIELGNSNACLKKGLTLWQERAKNIEELTRTLGMLYLAYNQLEQGETLSNATANNLKGRFAQALRFCFHDNGIVDEYCDNLPPLPDSIHKQKEWIDNQCSELRSIIAGQKEGLSDFVIKNDQ